jgi:DNA-binding transcriptional ArsR family regulator
VSKDGRRQDGSDSEVGDLLVALRHKLRRQILQVMADDRAISPKELHKRLAQPLANVSYHVRVLEEHNAITLVRAEPVRGSLQHFYRLSLSAEWALEVLGLQ